MKMAEPTISPYLQHLASDYSFLRNYTELMNSELGRQFLNNFTSSHNIPELLPPPQSEYIACVALDRDNPPLMLSHRVYVFTALMFVLVGLIGNALSIMVFGSKVMRGVSSNVYLLFLAISDSLYLVSVFSTKILTTLRCLYFIDQLFDIANRSVVLCKLFQYMQDLFSDYSTGLILAFTIERYIACYHPMNFKEICTVRRSRIACATLFSVTAVTIAPYHFMFIGFYQGIQSCAVLPDREMLFTILYVIEALIFRIVPVFIIAVLNVFIIVKVTKVNQDKMRRKSKNKDKKRRSMREDKHRQLTIMLILVSSSYIIAYLPLLVHFVLWKLTRSNLIVITESTLDMMQNYSKPMYIFGFAVNFFLYTISGRVFRDQLILMLCGKKRLRCTAEHTTENTALHHHHHHQSQPLTTMNGKHDHDDDDEKDTGKADGGHTSDGGGPNGEATNGEGPTGEAVTLV